MNHKKRFLLFFLLLTNIGLSQLKIKNPNLIHVNSIGEDIFTKIGLEMLGYNTFVLDSSDLYLYDAMGEYPLYFVNINSGEIKGFGSWGSGPGELQKNLPVVCSLTEKKLFIYSPLTMKLIIFDRNTLSFQQEVKTSNLSVGSVLYLFTEEEGIYIDMGMHNKLSVKYLGQKIKIDNDGLKFISSFFGKISDIKPLKAIEQNPMLKKGPVCRDNEGNVYFASYYSSLITGFNNNGKMRFINFNPRNIELPESKITIRDKIVIGDPSESTQCYLSLAVDQNNIYALFSGELITLDKIVAFRKGEIDLPLGKGKIVDIFDKYNGQYKFSFEIPSYANGICVYSNKLVLIKNDPKPVIEIYEMKNLSDEK